MATPSPRTVEVHGLDPREGETAFAFLVVRLREARDRDGVLALLRYLAPLVAHPEAVIDELPDELDDTVRLLGMPWSPPEAGHEVEAQRQLIEGAGAVGVETAWFFQTGTSLPAADDDQDEDEDEDDDEDDDDAFESEVGSDTRTMPIELADTESLDDDDDDDDDDETGWSHGPPPQATSVRFPVDGYPAILDELDWQDFGIAFKLAGPSVPGEGTVLLGFHTLWLAPYGGRHRNAAVTYDRIHHAAHLWVDRFAVPTPAAEQVHHLLWIVARIDEVIPVVHARFAEATMAQKYAGLMGDTREPFVLGGNPLLQLHTEGGEQAVDRWIAEQQEWSPEEVAQMLRELAIEVVTSQRAESEPEGDDEEDDEDENEDENEDEGADDDEGDDDDEGAEGEDRSRQITSYAGDVLRERAAAGKLDPRSAARLLPVLDQPEKFEHRRRAVVEILGALRYRAAVPSLIKILEDTRIDSSLDAIGKEDFIASTAAALGSIGDPTAIPALARVVAVSGSHNDKPRPVAAGALASCLQAAPEPRHLDDGVLAALLATIRERNDGELNAESHFAYGRIVSQLPAEQRAEHRRRLAETDSARDDAVAMLARQAALVMASPTNPIDPPPRDLQPLLHESLTSLDYDHDYTVRNLRVALRAAAVVPALVDPADVVWLTRFAEPDIRARAHALLERLGHPMPPARLFDRSAARTLDDDELARMISEPHVVNRAALVAEAGRRRLTGAYRAIIDACHEAITRARHGSANLLDPDTRLLEAAVEVLRGDPLDAEVVALFDRMLRHSNVHVKWELLKQPPEDERLIGGMFHVLGEKWGWQEKTARHWLARFQGTPTYEAERVRAGGPSLEAGDEADDEDDADDADDELGDDAEQDDDDQGMN
jgi:hypothetical protein